MKLIDDVDEMIDADGRDSMGERTGALALIEATRAQALAILALVEQQRVANKLRVAFVDQLTQIALSVSSGPGYGTDPSIRIRDYLTGDEWSELGL